MKVESDVEIVANYLLFKLRMSPKKLQKILFLSYGYYIATYKDKELFKNEFESWVHGPVIPSIFYKYRFAGVYTIYRLKFEDYLSSNAIFILEHVINKYGRYTALELEEITHNMDPWIIARKGLNKESISTNLISTSSIYNYFKNNGLLLKEIML